MKFLPSSDDQARAEIFIPSGESNLDNPDLDVSASSWDLDHLRALRVTLFDKTALDRMIPDKFIPDDSHESMCKFS